MTREGRQFPKPAPPVLAFALLFGALGAARGDPTGIVGATVIDGTDGAPLADGVVVMDGERIIAVGPRGRVAIPPAARIIDGTGKWLTPGLIDAHIHFFQSGGLYTRPDVIDLRDLRPYAEEIARIRDHIPDTFARYLASGVTSVVDVGGPFWTFEVREAARRSPAAPRVAVAGPLIATYAPRELRSADPPLIEVQSPEEARTAARRVLARQPDLLKIWFIRRPGANLSDQTALVRPAIEESHAAGVRVAVHATELETARAAVLAGADILAHSVDDRRVDDAFVELLQQHRIPYVTTLGVTRGYRDVLGRRVQLSDIERRVGDPEVIASFDDLAHLPFWKKPWGISWPGVQVMNWNLKRLVGRGILIAAGTDAGNIGTLHGPALHRELDRMAEAGLTPGQVLHAATRGGAEVIGRSGDLGTIEPGKWADMLVLDADPLLDVRNLRRIHRVVKAGRVFDPVELIPK